MKPLINIVDRDDNIIGYKKRSQLDKKDIYQVSALWLKNSDGDILLAKRALTKKHHPGLWGPAVAGTVDKGETYFENIIKETEEEIGITDISPVEAVKKFSSSSYLHFTQWFVATVDFPLSDFKIDPSEVAEIKWFSKDELLSALENTPENFLPAMQNKYLLEL